MSGELGAAGAAELAVETAGASFVAELNSEPALSANTLNARRAKYAESACRPCRARSSARCSYALATSAGGWTACPRARAVNNSGLPTFGYACACSNAFTGRSELSGTGACDPDAEALFEAEGSKKLFEDKDEEEEERWNTSPN